MEGAKANLIASKINSRIEVVTVSLYEYFERMPISPQMRNKTFGKLLGHHWPHYATI